MLQPQSLNAAAARLYETGSRLARSAPIAPSLLLGGAASVYGVKGLFLAQRLLQQTLKNGIEEAATFIGPPEQDSDKVDLVIPALRAITSKKSKRDDFLMQRKGASCGCMLLTRAGIFYIQAGDLAVFKASPWACSDDDLQAYQSTKILLSPKPRILYDQAVSGADTQIGHNEAQFSLQCAHMLLHMILSDIQRIVLYKHEVAPSKMFKKAALQLIKYTKAPGCTSADVLKSWVQGLSADDLQNWMLYMQRQRPISLFFTNVDATPRANSVIGMDAWSTGCESVDSAFMLNFDLCPHIDFWNTKPLIEPAYGKWAHIGGIRYSCYAPG
jgi:hypothetical protein